MTANDTTMTATEAGGQQQNEEDEEDDAVVKSNHGYPLVLGLLSLSILFVLFLTTTRSSLRRCRQLTPESFRRDSLLISQLQEDMRHRVQEMVKKSTVFKEEEEEEEKPKKKKLVILPAVKVKSFGLPSFHHRKADHDKDDDDDQQHTLGQMILPVLALAKATTLQLEEKKKTKKEGDEKIEEKKEEKEEEVVGPDASSAPVPVISVQSTKTILVSSAEEKESKCNSMDIVPR